ncbi:four helix bundle protein [Algoriphagus faecimaris]|uniref:Four helix bundle protein n=2 Tax=Algoriphagus TaxID=246875 RepID=A0A1G6PRF0_9BACT|nr:MULTISPECIES: four helix bundle protein [Algoriphagus]SDC82618.1 four helix bundle protein [Algoriphagus faecimaris]SFG64228.1 four helix bundle protein [Algoriphagus hitonicola]
MMGETFEDLKCWQSAYSLKRRIRKEVIGLFPKEERYELTSQLIRASRSSTANIAEGWGRFHFLESRKFYYNSRGSQAEVLDHLMEARDCEYISDELYESLRADVIASIKILNGYIRYLSSKVKLKE